MDIKPFRTIRSEHLPMHIVDEKVGANDYRTTCGERIRPVFIVDDVLFDVPLCEACSAAVSSIGSEHGTDTVPVEEADDC